MTERKWTPGPWSIGSDLTFGPNGWGVGVIVAANTGDTIADAHLIAAAPDLYEALDALYESDTPPDFELWMKAKAALAKARGEA
jgi:hypothetical protein